MKRKLKVYEVKYASGMFGNRARSQEQVIYSNKKLKVNDFIVVEHIDYGVFIGQVLREVSVDDEITDDDIIKTGEYKYVQNIDLSNYLAEKEKAKRKEELKKEMEKKFAEIDKEQKYKFYAELDSDFKSIYEEYKNL